MPSKWTLHQRKWSKCEKCDLCNTRSKVVLFRGKLPCDVLFIGEAPGPSEDTIGKPFVGPAGHLLDYIIEQSDIGHVSKGFTNIVACIPTDKETGKKFAEPKKAHIEACFDRLEELVAMAKPKLIVAVGKQSSPYCTSKALEGYGVAAITHPAAILRADVSQKGLAVQRCTVILNEAVRDIWPN